MKKLMLVGKTGSGKTTLIQCLQGLAMARKKTQAVTYSGGMIDTPGEFLENRRLYSALMVTSCACDVVGFVQDGGAVNSLFPPKFASMFSKPCIGIVSKADRDDCNIPRAEKFLTWAGVNTIFITSTITKTGINALTDWLTSLAKVNFNN